MIRNKTDKDSKDFDDFINSFTVCTELSSIETLNSYLQQSIPLISNIKLEIKVRTVEEQSF